jgi:hypothetical protein
MSTWLVILVMGIYSTVGFIEFQKGNYAFALMWFGYAISNIALAWMTYRGTL